jgi:3-methyladenine DNA glycosylase/8-oxoguanine DNA glycosylase
MDLKLVNTFTIEPTKPFDFDSTFHKPDHFPSNDNSFESGTCWHTYFWLDKQIGLKFVNKGAKLKPLIQVELYDTRKNDEVFVNSLKAEITYRYNLNLDLSEFYSMFSEDKVLSEPIRLFNGMRPGHAGSIYEYLIIGIVLQNCTVKRSVQMLQVLFENYGKLLKYDGKELWSFWKPGSLSNVTEEDLRKLKLGYRAKSIKKIDDAFRDGLIDEVSLRTKDMQYQKNELLKLCGVGPATVWYILFDIFHHYDFFEHISPWEQKIYSKLFFDREPENPVPVEELIRYFDRYGEYKQLAVHYIWENLWWNRKNAPVPWLEKLIRM